MTIVLPRPTLFQLARLPIVTMTIVLPRPTDIVPTSSFSTCYYDRVWGGDTSRGALDVFHIGKGPSGRFSCATFFFCVAGAAGERAGGGGVSTEQPEHGEITKEEGATTITKARAMPTEQKRAQARAQAAILSSCGPKQRRALGHKNFSLHAAQYMQTCCKPGLM